MQKSNNISQLSTVSKVKPANKSRLSTNKTNIGTSTSQFKNSSLDSIKSQASSYFDAEKQNKYHRTSNFETQLRRIERYNKNTKKQSDKVIKVANEIADKTMNNRANYHDLQREQPETVLLDHWRFTNDRILRAEEAKIKMECTPELIAGMYRRFLPQTVGRRNGIIDCDLQDAFYSDQYSDYFNRARDILTICKGQQTQQLDSMYESQKDALIKK